MSGFCEPPPQDQPNTVMTWSRLHDWLFRLSRFTCTLSPAQPATGGTGTITEVDGTAPISTTNPTGPVVTVTHDTSGVTAGTYGDATNYPIITVDADGHLTSAANQAVSPGGVTSVSSTDAALTISPTTGAVVASTNNFVGDSGSGGVHGVVPAPASGDAAAGKFLKASGGWVVPPVGTGTVTSIATSTPITGGTITTTGTIGISDFVASGTSHARGAVPDPGAVSGTTKFLREDATWDVPPGTGGGTVTSIATTAPITGGTITTTGTIDVSDFVASGASHARGTVPDPGAVAGTTKFLCEDATFKVVPSSAGGGMTKIGQVVTTSSAVTVTFSSIPATYTDLLITYTARDTTSGTSTSSVFCQFNSDNTASNYASPCNIIGTASSVSSSGTPAVTVNGGPICDIPNDGATANFVGSGKMLFPNYANTTWFKQPLGESVVHFSSASVDLVRRSFLYKSTSAISTIVLHAGTAFKDGSIFTLYGIG